MAIGPGRRQWLWYLIALEAIGLVALVPLYRSIGRPILRSAHRGESFGLLNDIMAGRSGVPIDAYLADADVLVGNLLALGVAIWLVQLVIFTRTGAGSVPIRARGPAPRPSLPRRALFVTILSVLALGTICISYAALYRLVYLPRLNDFRDHLAAASEPIRFGEVARKDLVQLGWAHSNLKRPETSYLMASRAKVPGTLRIGLFGDSYIEGEEAAAGHDVASFLARHLRAERAGPVEVLNFGVRGYGVHQSFMLWEIVGRHYGLDYTIVLPFSFHGARDTTFLYDANTNGPIHARYVLRGNGPERVSVVGRDRDEAASRYFSLLAPGIYRAYDARTPPPWRPILSIFGAERWNPFYYREQDGREATQLAASLLRKMAEGSRRFIALVADSDLADALEEELPADKSYVLRSQIRELTAGSSTPYAAPERHWSALGSHFVAAELAALLRGHERVEIPRLRILLEPYGSGVGRAEVAFSFSASGPLSLEIDGHSVAQLMERASTGDPPRSFPRRFLAHEESIESLLAIGLDAGDAIFVPFAGQLENGQIARLEIQSEGGSLSVPLATTLTADGRLGRARLDLEALARHPGLSPAPGSPLPTIHVEPPLSLQRAAVTLGGRLLLEVEDAPRFASALPSLLPDGIRELLLGRSPSRTLRFRPAAGGFVALRGGAGDYLPDLTSRPPLGPVELRAELRDGSAARSPVFRYELEKFRGRAFSPPYTHTLGGAT